MSLINPGYFYQEFLECKYTMKLYLPLLGKYLHVTVNWVSETGSLVSPIKHDHLKTKIKIKIIKIKKIMSKSHSPKKLG